MAGHTGEANEAGAYAKLVYLPCKPSNGFIPAPPKKHVDVIYLCSPNNPTGAAATREQLEAWVKYALEHKSVILFDAAYEAYITDPALPHSIYEIPGARECAIEFRSCSKNGGFTGVRCAFIVVPKTLNAQTKSGEFKPLHPLWLRRTTTKFNGVSYIVQRAAEALYSPDGKAQVRALIKHYLDNAKVLRTGAKKAGLKVFGGENAPYIWVRTPKGVTSWQAFDKILGDANVVITPGSGFGSKGEGFFRISAFNSRANAEEVARRLQELKW
jgi:LL-diaminopimelate aminotransferase